MADAKKALVQWLRDAHAMEAAQVDNIERNVKNLEQFPTVRGRFQQHLEVSRRHVEEIDRHLDRLGADRSMLKDAAMKMTGAMQPFIGGASSDAPLKHLIAAQAYEQFEVASYRSLGAAAQLAGETDISAMCDRFIEDERTMAEFIDQQLPEVTREHMARAQ